MEPSNPYNTPTQAGPGNVQPPSMRSVCVKRIDVVSAGAMLGALYAFGGLIAGGIMAIIAVLGAAAGGGGGDAALGGLIGGAGAVIFIPVIYGVLGFIGGIIGAVLYNLVAGFIGGIRMDVEG